MSIALSAGGDVLHGRHVRLTEYEPLEIHVVTPHGSGVTPDVLVEGASIGAAEVSIGEAGLSWRWTYRSESWCGRTRLTVVGPDGPIDLHIETRPSGTKYSEDQYAEMIDRILAYNAQASWGLAPGMSDAAEVGGARLGATHPVVIEHYMGPLLRQLEHLLTEPVLSHRRIAVVAPLRAAPVTSATVAWLASRPVQLERLRRGDRRVAAPQHVRADTFDHAANRYVVALIGRLHRSFQGTADALTRHVAGALVDPPERHRALRLAADTRAACGHLAAALSGPVLRDLRPGALTEGAVQVFSDNPAYGRFAKLARRLLDPGLSLAPGGGFSASLRRSWDLFEIYSLYRLLESLEEALGTGWTFDRKPPAGHVLSGPAEGRCWQASHPSGRRWRLYYQQWFGSASQGPFSATTGRRPDFSLALFHGNRLERWLLLDAKYRTAPASIREALQSMHVYRDSLAWRASPVEPYRRADAGYLLVPAIADGCRRYGEAEFLDRWGIGLLPIDAPGLGARLIRDPAGTAEHAAP